MPQREPNYARLLTEALLDPNAARRHAKIARTLARQERERWRPVWMDGRGYRYHAKRIPCNPNWLRQILSGKHTPNMESILKLSRYFRVLPGVLIDHLTAVRNTPNTDT